MKKYSMYAKRPFSTYYLLINKNLRNEPGKYLAGYLAHELCHFEEYRKMNLFQYSIHCIRTMFRKYRMKIERNTDIKTIQKGYGKELLFARKEDEKELGKKRFEQATKDYLKIKEIELLVKNHKRD